MRRKRHWAIAALAAGLMLAGFSLGVTASGSIQKVEAYMRRDFIVKVDGKTVEMAHSPLVYEGWSYVPLGELGKMLDIDVRYESKSKTIYINRNIKRQTEQTQVTSEEFELKTPMGYSVNYLGGQYPVLASRDYAHKTEYLRLSDLQRMGIDSKGLTLAKEKLTGEYYVRRDEVEKVWLEPPQFGYHPVPLITGEGNQDKIDALLELPQQMSLINPVNLQIVVIDALPQENHYRLLCYSNGKLVYVFAALSSQTGTDNTVRWYVSQYNSQSL